MSAEELRAVAALIDSLAWRAVFAYLLVAHRERIGNLLEAIEEFSLPGGARAKFRRSVEAATQTAVAESAPSREAPTTGQVTAAEEVEEASRRVDLEIVRSEVLRLADEYERTRARMLPGDERTRRMELVVSKMRTLGLAARPLLPWLMESASPGRRLAAIASLQIAPEPDSLEWLTQRLAETPFVGFHASVALLVAARALEDRDLARLRGALEAAEPWIRELPPDSDRDRTLSSAKQELARRAAAGHSRP